MRNPTEIERTALRMCLKAFGQAAEHIGFDKPLGSYSEAEALQALKSAGYGVELRESNRLPLLVYPSEKRGTFWPMGCGSLFCASATDAHRYLIAGGAA